MSQKKMTIEEAARHLGVSDRTVRSYIQDGWLSSAKEQGSRRKWLDPIEVEELRQDRQGGRLTAKGLRKELFGLRAEVRRLRSEMDAVINILDTQSKPLRFTAKDAGKVHAACLGQLQEARWELQQIQSWLVIFMRLREEDLQLMREATDDSKPWVPFLRLCLRMTSFIAEHPGYSTNLEMQRTHRELAEARRRLRVSALCYADLHSYDMDEALRRAQLHDSPASVRDLLSRIV